MESFRRRADDSVQATPRPSSDCSAAVIDQRGLPQLDLVSFRIDNPGKDAALRLVDPVEHIADLLSQDPCERLAR